MKSFAQFSRIDAHRDAATSRLKNFPAFPGSFQYCDES